MENIRHFIEFEGIQWDCRHGGAFDRGSADSWYRRKPSPHYYSGDTYNSTEVTAEKMNEDELRAYDAGYRYNEQFGGHKEY